MMTTPYYAVSEDLFANCLWEGLFPTVIEE
jgi:hypothetical protein